MLNLLIDRDNCLNEHIIYYNFSVLFEKSFWNLSSFCQIYLSLLNLFWLFLSTFFVFLKSLNNYFFRWFAYKSFPSRFSVLIKCTLWSSNLFLHPAVSHVFLGSVQDLEAGFRSSYQVSFEPTLMNKLIKTN